MSVFNYFFVLDKENCFGASENNKKTSCFWVKIVSEYDQEIPQSQNADKPMAPRGRAKPHRRMAENGFAPPPLGNFEDISYLVEN